MATVIEECIAEEQHSVVRYFVDERLIANDIHKEI
jgi:hypothetical protein